MRAFLFILTGAILLFCSPKDARNETSIEVKDTLKTDGGARDTDDASEHGAAIASAPPVTKLPFWAHFEESAMTELVKKAPNVYALPAIAKLNYFILDSSRLSTCNNGMPASKAFNFRRYRYKLPNVASYHVYIVCDTTFADYQNDNVIRKQCSSHIFRIHGYLILYDSLAKTANAINIQYRRVGIHGGRRTFDINADYVMHLQDYELSSETDDATEVPTLKYRVSIWHNGEIEIKTPPRNFIDEATGKILARQAGSTTVILPNGDIKKTSSVNK